MCLCKKEVIHTSVSGSAYSQLFAGIEVSLILKLGEEFKQLSGRRTGLVRIAGYFDQAGRLEFLQQMRRAPEAG
jgi:hypothetical protein